MSMSKIGLTFEREALNFAAMVKEIHDLDCVVCPYLKVKGGRHNIVIRCHHPALLIPIRLRGQPNKVLKWCPRRKVLVKAVNDIISTRGHSGIV